MSIVKDLIDTQIVRRDSDGFEVERTFIVNELSGNTEARLYSALISPGIPQYGDPHPIIPDIIVTNITAEPISSSESARVSIVYSIPDEDEASDAAGDDTGKLSLTSNLVAEETYFDANGELMTAVHVSSLNVRVKYGAVNVDRPQMRVTLSRLEDLVPKDLLNTHLGKLNDRAWSGFPAKTWLCAGIAVRENKAKFDIDYSFEYRAAGWRAEIIMALTNEEVAAAPIDVDTGNGFSRYDVYEVANFDSLGLSF